MNAVAAKTIGASVNSCVNDNDENSSYIAKGVTLTSAEANSEDIINIVAERLMKANPYDVAITRFERGNGFRGVKEATETAAKILNARLAGNAVDLDEMGDRYSRSYAYESASSLMESMIEDLRESYIDDVDEDVDTREAQKLVDDLEECTEEIIEAMIDIAEDEDDSKPADLFYSNDYCEIALIFMPPEGAWDDYMFCQGSRGYYNDIDLNEQSLDVMQRLGIRVGEYRKHSRNKNKARGNTRYRIGQKLISLDNFKEISENACSNFFLVVAYAHVPVARLLDIDFTQPIVLDKWAVGSWNPSSGTFHDVAMKEPLVVTPGMGRWVIPGQAGYSPDDVCGLDSRYYQSDMKNG